MRVRIDSGGRTHLPLCACGWRGQPVTDRGRAWAQARAHELRAHPGHGDAARAWANHTARH